MTGSNPYAYLFGPFVALLVVVGLAYLLRWAFARGGSLVERTPRRGGPDQYGLLVPVAAPADHATGEIMRRTLESNGIRATLTTTADGPRVMVFPGDESKARTLLER